MNGRVIGAIAFAFAAGGAAGWFARPEPAAPAVPAMPSARVHVPVPSSVANAPTPSSSAPLDRVFQDIYTQGKWATNGEDSGTSGLGSTVESTYLYRMFLARFFKEAKITSVVDAGCGDWEFSQSIDWSGIDYKGYDIVPAVVEKDRAKFEKPNIHFFAANVVDENLPPADLLIVKHVLQHLPIALIQKFLAQLPKYKHVLLIDTVDPDRLTGKNEDIAPGDFRFFDPTARPFNMPALKALTYWDGADMQQVVYVRPKR